MRSILAGLLVLASFSTASGDELVYEGRWVATNRPIDGAMTAVVTKLGSNRWHGHFYGVYNGVPYSYEVDFTGTPDRLRGTAVVDDANYVWSGEITQQSFEGSFGGDRYRGTFNLKRKTK
jgi:hypothetical protein